jgi:uncharacterized protein (DUF362 family)
METKEKQLVTGRRDALKILGLGSAALFASSFGNVALGALPEMEYISKQKPVVSNGRSSVSFTSGTDRVKMMSEVMKPFEKQIREGLKGKQLVIKPNLVSTNVPLCATHVDALRGVIEFIKPFYKGQIIIGESSAGKGDPTPGFDAYGYFTLQKDYNIKFLDFNKEKGVPMFILDKNIRPDKIEVSEVLVNPNNYVISLSRLKTHNAVIMTASTKNMMMGSPLIINGADGKPILNSKQKMHSGGPRWLHYNIFLVAKKVHADISIIDGVEGMEGNGPSSGTPVDHRIAMAGLDNFAVDAMCAKLMGIPLENVGYLLYAAADNMGIIDYDKIDIIGDKNPNDYIKTYKLHDSVAFQMQWKDPLTPENLSPTMRR